MIYFVVASHLEAKPLIEYFKLKKSYEISKFQVFYKNDIFLIESGIAMISSSIATTFILTRFGDEKSIALNIGICGAKEKSFSKGDIILCNKIINHHSKRVFYPDILIKHRMKEATLESFFYPVKKDTPMIDIEGEIVDMEGAGFFESASIFLPPHNIHCIKIVHDYLDVEKISPEDIKNSVKQSLPVVEDFVNRLLELNLEFYNNIFERQELEKIIERLKTNLHLTFSMSHQLKNLLESYLIRNKKLPENISDFLNLKVNSKGEGKKYFEELKKILIR